MAPQVGDEGGRALPGVVLKQLTQGSKQPHHLGKPRPNSDRATLRSDLKEELCFDQLLEKVIPPAIAADVIGYIERLILAQGAFSITPFERAHLDRLDTIEELGR